MPPLLRVVGETSRSESLQRRTLASVVEPVKKLQMDELTGYEKRAALLGSVQLAWAVYCVTTL